MVQSASPQPESSIGALEESLRTVCWVNEWSFASPSCGLRRGALTQVLHRDLSCLSHILPLCSPSDHGPWCTLSTSHPITPDFTPVSGCPVARSSAGPERGRLGVGREEIFQDLRQRGVISRETKGGNGAKWPGIQAELMRPISGEKYPSSSGSDITVIWLCLQLPNYGQFQSVTYPEITVMWIHL